MSCAKRLNWSTCRLGCELRWVEGSMCYLGTCWRHLANTIEPSVCGDATLWQITLTTCFSFDTVYRGLSHCVIVSESCLSQSSAILWFSSVSQLLKYRRGVKVTFIRNWQSIADMLPKNWGEWAFSIEWPIDVNKQLAKGGEECKFCFAVEDPKAEKLSASGAPGPRWGAPPLIHSYHGYACYLTPTF